jgi:choline dehydrogenase-like flavoprotein
MSPTETLLLANNDVQPNISLWAKTPLRFGAVYKRQLKKSTNITLYLNANVTDIQLHHDGHTVTALSVSTLEGKKVVMQARHFVLACGGLENARLLLVSRQVQTNGIGNQFDVVGRYYMDHPRAVFGKVKLAGKYPLPLLLGMPLSDGMAQVGMQFSERMQQQEGLLNNYLTLERHWSDQTAKVYQSFVRSMKIVLRKGYAGKRFTLSRANLAKIPELIYLLSPREIMPHFLYKHYKTLRDSLGGHIAELTIVNYCDQAPYPHSRVYLGSQRDRLQMPRLILDWKIGAEETRSLQRLLQVVDQHLRNHRIGSIDNTRPDSSDLSFTDASHHLGTTRMSDHPRQGVVDSHCRVFGVNNLFIAGSSVFPTAGHANPTLTIVALAIRLADHLKHVTKSLPH